MKKLAAFINEQDNKLAMYGIRELSNDEKTKLEKALKNISILKKLYNTDFSLKKNYYAFLDYIDYTEDHKEILAKSPNMQKTMHELLSETNHLLLNLLFSFTATVEHFKHNLIKDDHYEYEKMCSQLFDSCIEYAFTWKLRNFAQHQCLPITNIHVNNDIQKGEKIDISISKNELLKYDSWGKIVKPFITNQENTFEITQIIINAVTNLHNNIFLYWINKYISNFDEDIKIIIEFIKEINNFCEKQNKILSYPIILNDIISKDNDRKNLNFSFTHFPIEFLNQIGIVKIKNTYN